MMRDDEEDEDEQQQHQRAILEQVFGNSSDDDDDARSNSDSDSENYKSEKNWECISQVKGLWILRNFLTNNQQSQLLSSIKSENWFTNTNPRINQAMRFGYQNLPNWAIKLSNSIHSCCSSQQFPSNLLNREPFFDQMITNVYQPGEGICSHVDLLRFEDGIAIVSLESDCVMNFSLKSKSNVDDVVVVVVPVLVTCGSLVVMCGDARFVWEHEINRKHGFQLWDGRLLEQTTRTSITLRKLCSSSED